MPELWFGLVTAMFVVYAVLDGWDFGAGALHLLLARTDAERRAVLSAIGPYWDANEVWLIAGGGSLFLAFPRVLAAGLSGFYLAIFLVIWCLVLRAVAIELRSHLGDPMWRRFWDAVFAGASLLLALLFGVALGNLVRGLPLTPEGWFQLTLFTDFSPRMPVGILDAYTVFAGLFTVITLAGHGGLYLAWRTRGPLAGRAAATGRACYVAAALLWPLLTWATRVVNPSLFAALPTRPVAWVALLAAAAGLATVFVAGLRRRALLAFLGSSAFVGGLLAATAACLFPVLLRSIGDPALSITAASGGSDPAGLRAALHWWLVGIPLVLVYFGVLFHVHRAPVAASEKDEDY